MSHANSDTPTDHPRQSPAQRRIYSQETSRALPLNLQLRNPRHISDRPQYHPLPEDISRTHRRQNNLSQIPESDNESIIEAESSLRTFDSPPLDPTSLAAVIPSRSLSLSLPSSSSSSSESDVGLFFRGINSTMGRTTRETGASTLAISPIASPLSSGAVTPHMLETSQPAEMARSNFDANCLATLGKDGESIAIRVDGRRRARKLLQRLEGKAESSNGGMLGNLIRLHSVMAGNGAAEPAKKKAERPPSAHFPHSKSWTVLPNLFQSLKHPRKTAEPAAVSQTASMVDVRSAQRSPGLPKSISSARMSAMMMTPEAFARNGIIPPPSTHSTLRMNEKLSSGYFELDPKSAPGSPLAVDDERARLIDTISQILEKQDFLMHLARAWHAFGLPVHRMEANLLNVAKYLDIDACFFSVPGLTLISFGDPDTHSSETHIVRASDGYDMHRLEQVNQISRRLRKGEASVHESIRDIEVVMATAPIYPWYLRLMFSFVQSFFASMTLFHGSWREGLLAGGLGIMVGAFELLSSNHLTIGYLLNVVPPLIVALVAALLSDHICFAAVPMAASLNLLPGLGLALAMMELSSNNVICGTVRLVSATMTSFMLGWSTTVGYNLGMAILGKEGESTGLSSECEGLSMLWWILFVPCLSAGFAVWFKVHWKQWPAVIFASTMGLIIQTFCDRVHVMSNISAGIASFAIGLFSNLYGHFTHSTTNATIIFVGIIQLVPGSIGVRSFISYMSADMSATSLTMNMLTSAIGIAVGVILSNGAMYSELKQFRLGSF